MIAKLQELIQELRTVFVGRSLFDSVLPPVIYLILDPLVGFGYAIAIVLSGSAILIVYRLHSGQPIRNVWGGILGVLLAILALRVWDNAGAYFVPGIISSSLTVVICASSVVIGRPLVALTSYAVRRWPLGWYWHARVRPAYNEVTIAWMLFYALKLAIQLSLLQETQATVLVVVSTFLGWPATILLLTLSYIYGLWRLGRLQGPSVAEYTAGDPPPWEGQRRGF